MDGTDPKASPSGQPVLCRTGDDSFVLRFEWRSLDSRELVLLALLTAIAAVSRVPFAGLPSVQPTTFVIIVTAVVFGAESGFVVGAGAALVSNIFLGQGPRPLGRC